MKCADADVLLQAISECRFKRTPFESQFLLSMEQKVELMQDLSTKQGRILEEIYRKAQGGGQFA